MYMVACTHAGPTPGAVQCIDAPAGWLTRLDATFIAGQPYLSLSTSNWKLSLGAAAALLIAGKPVHLAHVEVGIYALLPMRVPLIAPTFGSSCCNRQVRLCAVGVSLHRTCVL